MCREVMDPVRATYLALHTVLVRTTAGELGLDNSWRRAVRKQIQRLAVRTRNRRKRRGERVFAGVSGRQRVTKTTQCCSLQRARDCKVRAPIFVSCLDDRHPCVLLVAVPLFVVCFSHQLLSARSPASSSRTRSSTSARHCLLRLEASARRLAGGCQSAWPSNVDHDEAETLFLIFVPERAVALTVELLVMYASRRLMARAYAVSKDRTEKDKEQQRLQFNSAVKNDDERRRPECSNGKISGEEIEDLDPGSFCGDRRQTGEVFKDVLSQSEYFKNQAKKTMSKKVLVTMVTKPGSVFLIPEIVQRLRHCEGIVDGVEDAVFVLSREELETFLKKYSDGGILSDDG